MQSRDTCATEVIWYCPKEYLWTYQVWSRDDFICKSKTGETVMKEVFSTSEKNQIAATIERYKLKEYSSRKGRRWFVSRATDLYFVYEVSTRRYIVLCKKQWIERQKTYTNYHNLYRNWSWL